MLHNDIFLLRNPFSANFSCVQHRHGRPEWNFSGLSLKLLLLLTQLPSFLQIRKKIWPPSGHHRRSEFKIQEFFQQTQKSQNFLRFPTTHRENAFLPNSISAEEPSFSILFPDFFHTPDRFNHILSLEYHCTYKSNDISALFDPINIDDEFRLQFDITSGSWYGARQKSSGRTKSRFVVFPPSFKTTLEDSL